MRSFLLLNHLLENADIFGLGYFDSEDLSFWIIIKKQAIQRECQHQILRDSSTMRHLWPDTISYCFDSRLSVATSILLKRERSEVVFVIAGSAVSSCFPTRNRSRFYSLSIVPTLILLKRTR